MEHFHQIVQSFLDTSSTADLPTTHILEDIFSLIRDQEEIRFFVDGTHHFGHQASSVNLMKRLIDCTEYAGHVRIIYAENSTLPPNSTINKLATLLPELDPRRVASTMVRYGTCPHISFLPYEERASLKGSVMLGFTGGADDMAINFAKELNVCYFLRLQPYLWDDDRSQNANPYYESSRIETPNGQYFYMTDEHPGFRSLPIKFSNTHALDVPDTIWTWYCTTQEFDTPLRIRATNARTIYQACKQNTAVHVWPLYGLHQFRDHIAEVAANIIFSALQAQQHIRQPILISCFNKPPEIPDFEKFVQPLSLDINNGDVHLSAFRSSLANHYMPTDGARHGYSPGRLDSFADEVAKQVMPWIENGSKLTITNGYDPATCRYVDVSERLNEALITAGHRDIIIALIGPVPADIYHYFYASSRLPGLFEGQTTSSLMVSLGRPFLQITREDGVTTNNYPSSLGTLNYAEISSLANDAAAQVKIQRFSSYIAINHSTLPEHYFKQLTKVSNFLVDAQDPSSRLASYFSSLGEYYQLDTHDKFVVGLMALLTAPLS